MSRSSSCIARIIVTAAGVLALPPMAHAQWPITRLKNVKVLPADITVKALVDTMKSFTRALGVRCTYCHVGKEGEDLSTYDFAADDRPEKGKAREMLRMVAAINGEQLPKLATRRDPPIAVQCATCHRGLAQPRPLQQVMLSAYDAGGADSLERSYRALRKRYYGSGAFDFGEVVLSDVADALAVRTRLPDAVRVHQLNTEMSPTSTFAHWMAGAAQLSAGDTVGAIASLRQAIVLNPNNQGARGLLERLGQAPTVAPRADLMARVTHGYASSGGVKIHYAALGDPAKPLVVLIHGFPDFWYTWRNQMEALSKDYYAVAMDQRGYNLSDKPKGMEQYDMPLLVGDVVAVIRQVGREKAVVVGHDWGGAVAWQVAITQPQVVEKLIILNLPHLRALRRELTNNPQQAKNSQYARNFQQDSAAGKLTAEGLAGWVADPDARAKYVEAFRRSDFDAMLAYYKRNYPREPYALDESPLVRVQAPVLMIHGLKDRFLMAGALNNSWDFLDADLTLVTVPNANHFVQHDAADLVSRSMLMWLKR